MFKIEKGIEIPPRKSNHGQTNEKRAFVATLNVGESFVFNIKNVAGMRKYFDEDKTKKFTTRMISKDQVRAWRIL